MYPDFKTFQQLAKKHRLVPSYLECAADLDTPVTVYSKLSSSHPYSVFLESVEGGEKFGRYSFISISHHLRFECKNNRVQIYGKHLEKDFVSQDPLSDLKKILVDFNSAMLSELPRFCGGAVGMFGYDMVRYFEKLPATLKDDLGFPDALFLLTDECVLFDHWKHKMILVKWSLIEKTSEQDLKKKYFDAEKSLNQWVQRIRKTNVQIVESCNPSYQVQNNIVSNYNPKEFCQLVDQVKEYIRAGDIIQTVISQRFQVKSKVSPFQLYRALRRVNPSPYLYLLQFNGFSIAGSSPELLVRKENNKAFTRPIAGTRKRGLTAPEDVRLEKELLADPKEKAEHLMLVDLGRNDLGKCCQTGSIHVPDFMIVERYSHVMHMVSSVEGLLKKKEDAFSLFKSCFPAGTVTGAAKIRSMQIIEELEKQRRNIYAGAIGYFSYSGNMDMAITIRTMVIKNNNIYVQAGAGIVADSVPEYEEKETRAKAAALFKAIELAHQGMK